MDAIAINLGRGVATVAGTDVAITPGPDGSLVLDGTTIRPLTFGERSTSIRWALRCPDPREATVSAVRALATGGAPADTMLDVLALTLAGASLASDAPGFADTALLVIRATNWTAHELGLAKASDVDALARSMGDRAAAGGWTRVAFTAPGRAAELDTLRAELADDLIRRAGSQPATAGDGEPMTSRGGADRLRPAGSEVSATAETGIATDLTRPNSSTMDDRAGGNPGHPTTTTAAAGRTAAPGHARARLTGPRLTGPRLPGATPTGGQKSIVTPASPAEGGEPPGVATTPAFRIRSTRQQPSAPRPASPAATGRRPAPPTPGAPAGHPATSGEPANGRPVTTPPSGEPANGQPVAAPPSGEPANGQPVTAPAASAPMSTRTTAPPAFAAAVSEPVAAAGAPILWPPHHLDPPADPPWLAGSRRDAPRRPDLPHRYPPRPLPPEGGTPDLVRPEHIEPLDVNALRSGTELAAELARVLQDEADLRGLAP